MVMLLRRVLNEKTATVLRFFFAKDREGGAWWFVKRNGIFGERKAKQTFGYTPIFGWLCEGLFRGYAC